MRKKNFLNADGYLIGNRIINPLGQPNQVQNAEGGSSNPKVKSGWYKYNDPYYGHGGESSPFRILGNNSFTIGEINNADEFYIGNISKINNIFGKSTPAYILKTKNISGFVLPQLEEIGVLLKRSTPLSQTAVKAVEMKKNSNAEGDATAPVNPILAPEMISEDEKGGMKICIPCTGAVVGIIAGLAAAKYFSKHPIWNEFKIKDKIFHYSLYAVLVGAAGYGIGFGINKLKK